jgi:hypothetical protein
MVRNNSSSPKFIAAKVRFLNSKGDIVFRNLATVNGFDATPTGKAAPLSYTTDPANFSGVTSYEVEPYERNR